MQLEKLLQYILKKSLKCLIVLPSSKFSIYIILVQTKNLVYFKNAIDAPIQTTTNILQYKLINVNWKSEFEILCFKAGKVVGELKENSFAYLTCFWSPIFFRQRSFEWMQIIKNER